MRPRPSLPGGTFAGHAPLPQEPERSTVRELLDGMAGDAGVRVSDTTGRPVYHGAALDFQRFTAPSSVNSDDSLAVLPITAHSARRALGRTRGIPGV